MYGAELFASHAARENAICLLMMRDHLHVWRYDRQDPIQCSALNFTDVENRVPGMMFSHKFSDSSTATIRTRPNLSTKGAQALYLIVFPELMQIMKLDGDNLLKCWWDTVKCHLALWKNGVHHRDVIPSNLMYKTEGGVVGVLIDFDLTTIEGGVTGNERIGTVPFMAMELLIAAELAGGIKHVYAHDAESFIWVLLWISIRYDSGNLRKHQWLKGDALSGCAKKKLYFLLHPPKHRKGSQGQERNLRVAVEYLQVLVHQYYRPLRGQPGVREAAGRIVDELFRKLLFDPLSRLIMAQPADFPDFRFENL